MSNLQDCLQDFLDALQTSRAETQMTLGKFIDLLEKSPNEVITGLGSFGKLHSYRGYYCDLAFEPGEFGNTVLDILAACKNAMGRRFTGYKGGEFLMEENTPLWVAEYGSCGVKFMGLDKEYNIVTEEEL